jgi:riboflavin kinase / FMN adenylyltransferase
MKVYQGLEHFKADKAVVLTIGSFDGVHLGHQELIARLKAKAAAIGGLSALMTFTPHPRIALNKDKEKLRLLTNDAEKEALLQHFGLDVLIFMPFDQAFFSQPAAVFLEEVLLDKIGVKHLVIGYDHKFGQNRSGDIHFLRAQSEENNRFTVEEISQQTMDELAVSSTKIRLSLEAGDVMLAQKLLGFPYSLSGEIVKGDQIGRKLGYPTANLALNDVYKQVPGAGVYATEVEVGGKLYRAMTYIGTRPTIAGTQNNIETNILDFQGDLYAQSMKINFLQHIRADVKFENLEELTQQISRDERKVRLYFGLPEQP